MIGLARWLGGFVRWLLKGCKTKLKDEVNGNLEASWGWTYDTENYIIGLIVGVIYLCLVYFIYL